MANTWSRTYAMEWTIALMVLTAPSTPWSIQEFITNYLSLSDTRLSNLGTAPSQWQSDSGVGSSNDNAQTLRWLALHRQKHSRRDFSTRNSCNSRCIIRWMDAEHIRFHSSPGVLVPPLSTLIRPYHPMCSPETIYYPSLIL